jgi:hypothetical protein
MSCSNFSLRYEGRMEGRKKERLEMTEGTDRERNGRGKGRRERRVRLIYPAVCSRGWQAFLPSP